ncbi:MAG: aminotransferase class IV [Flavobacteriales bacterium]|nr:aminotransferase class IV [Flavobacteriales bacterium]
MNGLIENRAFLYGDGFFETFVLRNGENPFWDLHYKRILASALVLKMEINPLWNEKYFADLLKKESQKYPEKQLRVKIVFFRSSSGWYLPVKNEMSFEIFMFPCIEDLREELRTGIYHEALKPVHPWSNLKTTSSLFFVMAALYMKEENWEELIILNQYGRICEGLTSNLFIRKNDIYYTPPLTEGCVNGINRKSLIESQKFTIVEKVLEVEELKDGEVFFSNSVRGFKKGKLL